MEDEGSLELKQVKTSKQVKIKFVMDLTIMPLIVPESFHLLTFPTFKILSKIMPLCTKTTSRNKQGL